MSIGGYLAFNLYIGAAFHDADEDQRYRMRQRLLPQVAQAREVRDNAEAWGVVAKSMLMVVHEVMGPSWAPQGEWMEAITSMIGEMNDRARG